MATGHSIRRWETVSALSEEHREQVGGHRFKKIKEWVSLEWPIRSLVIVVSSLRDRCIWDLGHGSTDFSIWCRWFLFSCWFQSFCQFSEIFCLMKTFISLLGIWFCMFSSNVVAFLAAVSTDSFPVIPECPGIQIKFILVLFSIKAWWIVKIRCTIGRLE